MVLMGLWIKASHIIIMDSFPTSAVPSHLRSALAQVAVMQFDYDRHEEMLEGERSYCSSVLKDVHGLEEGFASD
jgi:hypothetical protein